MVIRFFHSSDARSRPSHSSSLLAFGPGPHRAFEDHLPFMGFDGDAICIDFRAAAEGFLDLALDLAGRDARFDLYRIGDPLHAFYPPYSAFGRRSLIVPLDIAFQSD